MSRVVCVGTELGRLSLLEVGGGSVTAWSSTPLEPGTLRQGDPADPTGLGELIRERLAAAGIQARRARLTISDEAVVTRVLRVPRMPRRHLAGAVRYLAEREVPIPSGEARCGWQVLGRKDGSLEVFVVAAWSDVVERLKRALLQAGLLPELIEPRWLAVARALRLADALVLEGGEAEVRSLLLAGGRLEHSERVPARQDGADSRLLAEVLARQALRRAAGPAAPPVLLAGRLDASPPSLSIPATRVSETLNGHGPARPAGLPAGGFLAELGLASR